MTAECLKVHNVDYWEHRHSTGTGTGTGAHVPYLVNIWHILRKLARSLQCSGQATNFFAGACKNPRYGIQSRPAQKRGCEREIDTLLTVKHLSIICAPHSEKRLWPGWGRIQHPQGKEVLTDC